VTARPSSVPLPAPGPQAAAAWVREHLGHLTLEGPDGVRPSPAVRGGQSAADAALAALDLDGYAGRRNEVWPATRRGASRMSPYVRYGLVDLPTLWRTAGRAAYRDREKYRDELLWQEYARHVYARLGAATRRPMRRGPAVGTPSGRPAWDRRMACADLVVGELEQDGWLVNQTRMWLASLWTVRSGLDWQDGEDAFFTHLLDGSRAANRLGWQWTVGAGTGKPYGFSRWQVEKRAPGLCGTCPLRDACPVQDWPDAQPGAAVPEHPRLRRDPDPAATGGPASATAGGSGRPAEAVWLTFESMGDGDPALTAHPALPVVAVFDEPLLARLRLSGKRLVFLAETLADLALRRPVELHVGAPGEVLAGRALAATYAPVPGWRRLAAGLDLVEVHPWPWLVRPHGGSASSYTAWRRGSRVAA
jgi:deoxyribodipyrimidine photo-lyase